MHLSVVLFLSVSIFVVRANPTNQWQQEQAQAAGAMMMADGMDRMRDGVSTKEKYSRKFDFFGVPVGGEIGYKFGAGDSLNRDKRQVEAPPKGDEEQFDFDLEIPEEDLNGTDAEEDPKRKKWHRKLVEACIKFLRRVGEFFSRATNE